MLPKVFRAQLRRPSKGDWTEMVKKDLEDFKINLSFDKIKRTSKDSFKKIVILACKKYSFNNLLLKQTKRQEKSENSKGNKLKYSKLQMQNYLSSSKITMKEAKLLFKIRTNMLEVKKNYKRKGSKNEQVSNEDITCPLCKKHIDSEENVFKCEELSNMNTSDVEFEDLFSNNEEKMFKCLKHFQKLWKLRQTKLENQNL